MFDNAEVVARIADTVTVLADPGASDIERFRAFVALSRIGEAGQALALADMAGRDGWDREGEAFTYEEATAGRRLVRVGADGAPMDEALPLEIACATHTTVASATMLIRDVVDLKSRCPHAWQAVCETRLPVWQARGVAQLCAHDELDRAETAQVDARLARSLGLVSYGRLRGLTRAAIMRAAPGKVARRAEQDATARYCRTGVCEEDPASGWISARLDAADAVAFGATRDRLADLLGAQGDQRCVEERRACAAGIMAIPPVAAAMLDGHSLDEALATKVAALPVTQVFLTLNQDGLTDPQAVARAEKIGPVLVQQVSRLVGHNRVRVQPVLRLDGAEPVVDAHETPDRIREHVIQRDQREVFPYSSKPARGLDMDHVIPYRPGRPGQTRPSNLAPLSRKVHRAKTHCGWRLVQTEPGVFWWRTEMGQVFRVGPDGATDWTDTS